MKGVRPVSLHISDRISHGMRKTGVPPEQIQATSSGIVQQGKVAARGDYQCNLPMSIHSRVIRPLKQPDVAKPTAEAGEGGKQSKKKAKIPPLPSRIKSIPSTPTKLDLSNVDDLPNTPSDLSYIILSNTIRSDNNPASNHHTSHVQQDTPTQLQDSVSTSIKSKPPSQSSLTEVDNDPLFDGVSVAPAGFLNMKLRDDYISRRLYPFLMHNDAPPLLLYESDMAIINPTQTGGKENTSTGGNKNQSDHYQPDQTPLYDDRPLSLIQSNPHDPHDLQRIPVPAFPRIVSIDYAGPNIAKEMHVGHIRSTVIGDSLARLCEFSGATVQRFNHLGDWGTQFGMLLCHFKDIQQQGVDVSNLHVSDLQVFYREAKIKFDTDDEFKTNARLYVVRLQNGDPECLQVWSQFCSLSSVEFKKILSRLQIDPRLMERGESFYSPFLPDVVQELLDKGVAIEKDGAVILPPRDYFSNTGKDTTDGETASLTMDAPESSSKPTDSKPKQKGKDDVVGTDNNDDDDDDNADGPEQETIAGAVVLRKSDGGYTYGATDMAALRLRLLGPVWHDPTRKPAWFDTDIRYKDSINDLLPADWALYVVDSGQSMHFARIFDSGQSAGWITAARENAEARRNTYIEQLLQDGPSSQQDENTTATHVSGAGNDSQKSTPQGLRIAKASSSLSDIEEVDLTSHTDTNDNSTSRVTKPDLRIEHLGFGVVLGENHKRLRTRSGEQIKLSSLLDESVTRASEIIQQQLQHSKDSPTAGPSVDSVSAENNPSASTASDSTIETPAARRQRLLSNPRIASELAETIGYGSVKYADLHKNRISDYVFSFDKMLDMQGDTAGYLLYAHARLFSLLQRAATLPRYHPHVQQFLTTPLPDELKTELLQHNSGVDDKALTLVSLDDASLTPGRYKSLFEHTLATTPVPSRITGGSGDDMSGSSHIDGYHAKLVASALSQYASPFVLDESTAVFKKRPINNSNIWSYSTHDNTSSSRGAGLIPSSEHVRQTLHHIKSIHPDLGCDLPLLTIDDAETGVPLRPMTGSTQTSTSTPPHAQFPPLIALDHASERQLALHIAQFHDAVMASIAGMVPSHLCEYTMQLSTHFSSFYRDCSVLGVKADLQQPTHHQSSQHQNAFSTGDSRILLTHAATVTLQRSLALIGIQPVKMM